MLGNPLVRFCEGQGGNQMMVLVTPSLRAPCLLDRPSGSERGCNGLAEVKMGTSGREGFWFVAENKRNTGIAPIRVRSHRPTALHSGPQIPVVRKTFALRGSRCAQPRRCASAILFSTVLSVVPALQCRCPFPADLP